MQTALIVLEIIVSIALIIVVLLQSGKEDGLSGALTGGNSESYMSKNKRATLDKKLAASTKWLALLFVVVTLALVMVLA